MKSKRFRNAKAVSLPNSAWPKLAGRVSEAFKVIGHVGHGIDADI